MRVQQNRRFVAFGLALLGASVVIRAETTDVAFDKKILPGAVVVHLKGTLNVVKKLQTEPSKEVNAPYEFLFATVNAGGAPIAIDANGCPAVLDELLNHGLREGGLPVSSVLAEVSGQISFVPFGKIDESKYSTTLYARNIPAEPLVPVVRVEVLQIQVLPGSPSRKRNPVKSTKSGVTNRRNKSVNPIEGSGGL